MRIELKRRRAWEAEVGRVVARRRGFREEMGDLGGWGLRD